MSEFRKYLNENRGSGVFIARELGVTPGAVTQWADKQVPAERVFVVSKLTGIPIEKLRPDIMGDAA